MYHAPDWLTLEQEVLKTKAHGQSLLETTSYRGIALWWFIRRRLYHQNASSQLVRSFVANTYFVSLVDFFYDFFTSILCRMLLGYSRRKRGHKKHFKVLITAENVEWKSIRDPTGRLRKYDAFFDSVMTELKKRDYDVATVYPLRYSLSGLRIMTDKLKRQRGVTHKPFNIYWSMKIRKKAHDAGRHFRNIWKNIFENDGKIIRLLEEHGLKAELSHCFNIVFERVVKNIEMAIKLVEEEEPDLILLEDEYEIFERALFVAGKLKGIPTLAIQHGNIGPLHMGYMYSKDNLSAHGSIKTPYCPIPDKIAVYGPFYYDLLTKTSAFPPNAVVITGQPRYDRLAISDEIYSRENFCTRLGLDPHRKIILIATQPIPIRETFIKSILRGLKNFPEIQIVIKPHPGESDEVYRRAVEEENVKVKMLSEGADTIEALYSCDLLVAAFSTVITEALVLGKLVVTLNLSDEDLVPYYKGYVLKVNREQDLPPAIRKALYDEKTKENLRRAGKEFVFNHTYKQDGKATERIVNLVEQMIKKKI